MFPIRDDAPKLGVPYVTYFLIILNVLVFFFEVSLPDQARSAFIFHFGMIPASVGAMSQGIVSPEVALLPILTSMFLHASWLHLIFNMWALWIFGDNIETHIGHFPYLLLYLLSGFAASLAHYAFNSHSAIPSVGASGAIAGVMGAYFLLFPSARVLTLVPLFFSLIWLPAWLFLGFWFLAEFLSGAATSIAYTRQTAGGGIAFWAHVGGFLAGALLVRLFPARPQRYNYGSW